MFEDILVPKLLAYENMLSAPLSTLVNILVAPFEIFLKKLAICIVYYIH